MSIINSCYAFMILFFGGHERFSGKTTRLIVKIFPAKISFLFYTYVSIFTINLRI